jgi:hypothetical protein
VLLLQGEFGGSAFLLAAWTDAPAGPTGVSLRAGIAVAKLKTLWAILQ